MYFWTCAGLALLTLLCVAMVTSVLPPLLARLHPPPRRRSALPLAVPLALVAWLLLSGALAADGWLAVWEARPPRLLLIPLLALAGVVVLHRSALLRGLIDAAPRHWPVAMQIFRIGVELSFLGLYLAGGAPRQVTFEGRNFDVLVGLTAPFVAFAIRYWQLAPRSVIVWNALGLAILTNTIFTTLSSTPGPAHLDWPGLPFTGFGHWPFVWIPAFLAPLAIFLHVFSIRQNLALLRRGRAPVGAGTH
ncbi:hypothetical protein [Rugamonas sp.]|uniref:hypothetical protein n=1 Tax=Rugamonas sp. TaxID=1926287 RepID=UPI0025F1606E|nr:hypothetical protein [Rugamonas sp.]